MSNRSEIDPASLEALRAVCEALVPQCQPTRLGVAESILETAQRLPRPHRREFFRLTRLLSSPLLGLTWMGPLRPADRLPRGDVERMLQRWARSPVPQLRKAFHAVKRLAGFYGYSLTDADGANPSWDALGYPGPLSEESAEAPPLSVRRRGDTRISCQVLVIGSGAGGGVVAGMLATRGIDTVVVEKGPYIAPAELSALEAEMIPALYESGGSLTTQDGTLLLFAGSCLGGGTTVNWTTSLRTPETVLHEWADEFELPHLISSDFAAGMHEVLEAAHVTTEESPDNRQNSLLRRGSEILQRSVNTIPRNVAGCVEDGCRGCGFCGMGCRKGKKRGTVETWLRLATGGGARLFVESEVERITLRGGRAVSAIVRRPDADLVIEFDHVVLAAGALHTPILLLRSGIEHPELGRNLRLHPTVAVSGYYQADVEPWFGAMQTAVDDHDAHLDGGFGFRIETPPVHPGIAGMALPWTAAAQHRADMVDCRRSAHFIVLTRDRDSGRVVPDREGRPVVHYHPSSYDRNHILAGMETAVRLHGAAGARRIFLPHRSMSWETGDRSMELAQRVRALRWATNDYALFSAHQMATCRMGGHRRRSPTSPTGNLYDHPNVWIADGSVMPSSSGVNPMMTIQALAHHTARGLLDSLS